MRLTLKPHPDTPCATLREIAVEVARSDARLSLVYEVAGDLTQVRLPDPQRGGRADELWKHTCLEAFVAAGAGYREINLSPSQQWAAYAFDGYREGMRGDEAVRLESVADERTDERYQLTAVLELTDLVNSDAWSLGLSAVIELQDGSKSYWALAHAPGPPDFHHPDAFAAVLPPESP